MISASSSANKQICVFLLLAVLAISGCGSDASQVDAPKPEAGATSTPSASAPTGATGADSSTSPSGEGVEEASTFLIRIGLRDGKFTPGTERQIAVIDGVDLQFEFDVRDDRPYAIQVTDDKGSDFDPYEFDTRGDFGTVRGPLEPGQTLLLTLRDEQIKITTDFEPGP